MRIIEHTVGLLPCCEITPVFLFFFSFSCLFLSQALCKTQQLCRFFANVLKPQLYGRLEIKFLNAKLRLTVVRSLKKSKKTNAPTIIRNVARPTAVATNNHWGGKPEKCIKQWRLAFVLLNILQNERLKRTDLHTVSRNVMKHPLLFH